jgi:excisionase family DNA binding protein
MAEGSVTGSAGREIMTPQEVADYLKLSPETVYRYIREGKLVASRFGRQYRITRRNVELLLLTTATAGEAELRRFTRAQVDEWLREDALDEETERDGQGPDRSVASGVVGHDGADHRTGYRAAHDALLRCLCPCGRVALAHRWLGAGLGGLPAGRRHPSGQCCGGD